MIERYSKRGLTTRWERTAAGVSLLLVDEHGLSEWNGSEFRCRSAAGSGSASEVPLGNSFERQADRSSDLDRQIVALVQSGSDIERLTIVDGSAHHQFISGDSNRTWQESYARMSVSVVSERSQLRCVMHLGETSLQLLDPTPLQDISALLPSARRIQKRVSASLSLNPHVGSAFWPHFFFALLRNPQDSTDVDVRFAQRCHPDFILDGRGEPILPVVFPVSRSPGESQVRFPNVYRPSYRHLPVSMPMNLMVTSGSDDSSMDYEAIGLLSEVHTERDMISADLLLREPGAKAARAVRLQLTAQEWVRSIRQIAADARWFPEAAGVFSATTILGGVTLLPCRQFRKY